MDFIELSQARRSIRGFKEQSVSKDDLLTLLKAAQSAPSAGNCQPWHFFIISDKSVQADIKNKSCRQDFILTASVFIVVCADIKRSENKYGERGRNLYSIQDTAAAIQNILLCAKSLGLGACWCGAFDENALSEILHMEKDLRPVAIIPVGYPVNDPVSVKRRSIDEIATFVGDEIDVEIVKDKETPRVIEHCDMGETSFDDVNLRNSKFNNINFYCVEISEANLTDGKIHDCNLSNLEIYNSNLDGMKINRKDVCKLLQD